MRGKLAGTSNDTLPKLSMGLSMVSGKASEGRRGRQCSGHLHVSSSGDAATAPYLESRLHCPDLCRASRGPGHSMARGGPDAHRPSFNMAAGQNEGSRGNRPPAALVHLGLQPMLLGCALPEAHSIADQLAAITRVGSLPVANSMHIETIWAHRSLPVDVGPRSP